MADRTTTHCFKQLHVAVARNATDDFNPFHDPHRWHQIRDNPFGGPIVLGFQLAALADSLVQVKRETEPDDLGAKPRYSSYEFRFAGALRPNESFTTQVRRTVRAQGEERAAVHRMIFRKQTGEPILLGSRSDSLRPAGSSSWRNCQYEPIGETNDRCYLPDGRFFLKRKYLSTSNGKNFLLGSLVDQYRYFDELSERVSFPPMFTASLISCALLERLRAEAYDFEAEPQVYVAHRIVVDRSIQQALRSSDRIDLLVDAPTSGIDVKGLSQAKADQQVCVSVVAGRGLLFCAEVRTACLSAVIAR